jgi:exonuclease SbcC
MHLLSLQIQNFRVIRRAVLPLPDHVIGVIGPNGAGKSSLVEAVAWALYGNPAARSGKDEIKSQFAGVDDNCEVILQFEVKNEPYRVVRRLVGRTERAEVQLYRGETSESVGVSETQAYISRLLGLDLKGFLTSFLARQQELNTLSDLQPSRRRDHLAGLLGIERLDKGIIRLKEDLRVEAGQIDFMERQLAERAGLSERIKELTTRLGELSAREGSVTDAVHRAEIAVRETIDRFTSEQARKSDWVQITSRPENPIGYRSPPGLRRKVERRLFLSSKAAN